ncbi:hypothetical protein [Streptomyces roseifaciens]|uniref:hypothetical protein n=1 Tax=Streptomyces roseifaciens TaxID=1488406 RepID=UPI000718108E|nr:hypothetical protein [Streptomyces roseifaciens]
MTDHIGSIFGTAEDGRLFRAARGGHVLTKEYGATWKTARLSVLTEVKAQTPLTENPWSARLAGVSL